MRQDKPNIFNYHDYREFLKDLFKYLKGQRKGFTVAKLARSSDISYGYISTVLKGGLKLSEKILSKLAPHLPLSTTELDYLRTLCILTDSESQEEKAAAIDQIQHLGGFRKLKPQEAEVYEYLSHWYYVAIREMASLPDFQLEAKWIQDKLWRSVPLNEIQKAMDFLLSTGFLEKLSDGKVRPPEKNLVCMDMIHKVALVRLYSQFFSLAIESSDKIDSAQRSIKGFTVAIPSDRFEEVRAMLDETLKKVVAFADTTSKPDSVYQISLIGFPLSQIKGKVA